MLTPSRYYYDGYFLPIKHFEIGVFWDKHAMNESSQIIPNNLALDSAKGSMRINLAGSASSAVYSYRNGKYEYVNVITLNEYVRENNLKIGFIKVDIEGSEVEFLHGTLETIKTKRPAMLISIYHHAEQFFGIKPFIQSLNLGYKFKIHKPVDNTISIETALYCEIL